MKRLCVLLLICSLSAQAQINLKKIKKAVGVESSSLSKDEVAAGLKEALTKGISKGAEQVSQLDGYFKNPEIKLPFPEDVKHVEKKLRQIGMGDQVDKFILSLNRAAEDAAKESKPVFVAAIKSMTINDAMGILKGEDDAATSYLRKTTSVELHDKFNPVIKASLDKVDATKYYSDLIKAYNKIPLVDKVNPNLDEYATEKAMQGLFIMIAKEEKNIRQDPAARTSALLKKVFGSKN